MGKELGTLLGVLESVGYPVGKASKLKMSCEVDLAKGKPTTSLVNDAIRRIQTAAEQFKAALPELEGDARTELARTILRLDASVDEAHAALGKEQVGDEWVTADEKRCRTRRPEIASSLQLARRLEVEVTTRESQHPFLAELLGHPGVEANWRNITLYSGWSPERTSRILREAVRGLAFSSYLRTGALELPDSKKAERWIIVNSRTLYTKAIDLSLEQGGLDTSKAEQARQLAAYFDKRDFQVCCPITEGEALSALLCYFAALPNDAGSCLVAGHLNWVSMEFFGAHLPGWAWTETKGYGSGRPVGETGIAPSEEEKREREEYLRLSRAGIAGCRSYMAYLVERGEDPPWSRSMLDQVGKITGEDLLKSTSVVEFLQELGPLQPLFSATDLPLDGAPEHIFEKALGEPVAKFEERWRRWVLPSRQSLVDRLEQIRERLNAKSRTRPDPSQDVLGILNGIRASALKGVGKGTPAVSLDASLSDGARLHALYLSKNPKQVEAWPDAHEEYADREGFTPEGTLAGAHSVIHPGIKSAQDSIDGWMGTFYHRLPLLDPGLIRVGWGFENGYAVLDVASLCAPASSSFEVVWPYNGMTSVPMSFNPELPNPTPGKEQSDLGYPVTLQVGIPQVGEDGSDLTMKLLDGKNEVECYFSSPGKPTNPDLAPKNSYCLIPKAHLKPKTKYTVHVVWISSGRELTWSFGT